MAAKSYKRRVVLRQLAAIYGHHCWWCKRRLKFEEMTFDHYPIPKCDGGPMTIENGVVACFGCNNRRGNGRKNDQSENNLRRANERKVLDDRKERTRERLRQNGFLK